MALSRIAITLILSSALAIAARPVDAQSTVRFGLQAGATIPLSSYGSDKHAGYHLGLLVDARTPLPLLGYRVEGVYHEMKYSGNTTRAQIWTATADAELNVPTPTFVTPYAIGGIGIYNSHRSLFLSTGSSTNPGVNLGGGLRFRFSDVAAFVEARYHRATGSNGIRFVPITLGILL
jgi:opacity protein-like surface antigen